MAARESRHIYFVLFVHLETSVRFVSAQQQYWLCTARYKRLQAPLFQNSAYGEQQNVPVKRIQVAAAHMHQFTLMWRLQWMAYWMNEHSDAYSGRQR
jgi:hypothetical protein